MCQCVCVLLFLHRAVHLGGRMSRFRKNIPWKLRIHCYTVWVGVCRLPWNTLCPGQLKNPRANGAAAACQMIIWKVPQRDTFDKMHGLAIQPVPALLVSQLSACSLRFQRISSAKKIFPAPPRCHFGNVQPRHFYHRARKNFRRTFSNLTPRLKSAVISLTGPFSE